MCAGEINYSSSLKNGVNSLSSSSWPKSFYLEAVPGNNEYNSIIIFFFFLEKSMAQCLNLNENYNGLFESQWKIISNDANCFWEYENDPFGDLSIHFMDLSLNNDQEGHSSFLRPLGSEKNNHYIIRKDYFCKNGMIKFKFLIESILLF